MAQWDFYPQSAFNQTVLHRAVSLAAQGGHGQGMNGGFGQGYGQQRVGQPAGFGQLHQPSSQTMFGQQQSFNPQSPIPPPMSNPQQSHNQPTIPPAAFAQLDPYRPSPAPSPLASRAPSEPSEPSPPPAPKPKPRSRPPLDPQPLPSGRIRVSKACDACNQRRRKCSGELPRCDRCAARGISCVYTDTGRKRGPAPSRRKRKRESDEEEEQQSNPKKEGGRDRLRSAAPRLVSITGLEMGAGDHEESEHLEVGFVERVQGDQGFANGSLEARRAADGDREIRYRIQDPMFGPGAGYQPEVREPEPARDSESPRTSSSPGARSPNMAISALLSDFDESEFLRRRAAREEEEGGMVVARTVSGGSIPLLPEKFEDPSEFFYSLVAPSPTTTALALFSDLPDLPSTPSPLDIFGYYLAHVDPLLDHLMHRPTMRQPSPLLFCAILGFTVPLMPLGTQRMRQDVSLAYFRRAQRLLQPLLPEITGTRPPSFDEAAGILILGLLCGTNRSSAQLGYRMGFLAGSLVKGWQIVRPESIERELRIAAEDPRRGVQRERWRRLVWLIARNERFSASAVDWDFKLPVLSDDLIQGVLIPAPGDVFSREKEPVAFLEAGVGTGKEVMADVMKGRVKESDEAWKYRAFVLLGWTVEFHKLCVKHSVDPFGACGGNPEVSAKLTQIHRALADFRGGKAPPTAPFEIWVWITYHMCLIVLHTPREGALMDPAVLLGNSGWLGSRSFATATMNASSAAALLSRLHTVDPNLDELEPFHIAFAQMVGVVCYISAAVSHRLGDEAGREFSRLDVRVVRRQQERAGLKWRMAAQMAVFLGKLEETLDLPPAGPVPVVWTPKGLLVAGPLESRMLGWDEAVGFDTAHGGEEAEIEAEVRMRIEGKDIGRGASGGLHDANDDS